MCWLKWFNTGIRRLLPSSLVFILVVVAVPLGLFLPVKGPLPWMWRLSGIAPLLAGLWLTWFADGVFGRVGTNIDTFGKPDVLVEAAPFSFSRNPMYLGFSVALGGVALLVGSVTALVAPVSFTAAAAWWYIPFEEDRMLAAFGRAYVDYQSRVPRWFVPRWTR